MKRQKYVLEVKMKVSITVGSPFRKNGYLNIDPICSIDNRNIINELLFLYRTEIASIKV